MIQHKARWIMMSPFASKALLLSTQRPLVPVPGGVMPDQVLPLEKSQRLRVRDPWGEVALNQKLALESIG